MDRLFPLDSNFKHADPKKLDLVPTAGDIRSIKRISKVERDLESGYYTYWLEEKFPEPWKTFKGAETFGYFKEWLMSQGDSRCYIVAKQLEKSAILLDQMQFKISG